MGLKPYQNRTWASIDLNAATYNFNAVRRQMKPETKLCCVVKANGYGHGAVQLSRLYEKLGADYLAVSNIEEALQLRNAHIQLPILVLGYTDPHCASELAHNNITQCVFSYEYGKSLAEIATECGVVINTHIKLDTGMGRIGFRCDRPDLDNALKICNLPSIHAEGIFTHFSSADEGDNGTEYTLVQYRRFTESIKYLETKGIHFSIRHCANSAGIFDYPDMHLDMVRAGIVLYGLQPSHALHNVNDLKPILSLNTIIDHVKIIQAGDFVSYGREFCAEQPTRVATIPIGYADGLWRSNYRNHMVVEIEGKYAPIIGRICMDQCMIDVSSIPEADINSNVTVYGASGNISVDHIAAINSTINYEIVCALGERVPRVYMENGNIVAIADNLV